MGVLYAKVAGTWQPILGGTTGDFLPLTGGTLTGDLSMAPPARINFGTSTPQQLINLFETSYAIGMQASGDYIRTGNNFAIYRGGVHSNAALDPGSGGTCPFQIDGGFTWIGYNGGSAAPLRLIGGSLNNCFLQYNAENDGKTTRSAYVGFNGSSQFRVRNEKSGGDIVLDALNGDILFQPLNIELCRMKNGFLLIGKTATGWNTTGGHEIEPTGKITTTTDAAVQNIVGNKIGAGNAVGQSYYSMYAAGTAKGSIAMTAGGVAYNTTSDGRLKDVIGPITQPVERVRRLRPVHFAWKASGHTEDGFITQDVQQVEPNIVVGEPDALTEDGEIDPQQMDASKLIPLLTAAIQQQQQTIESLTARIEALEAA